MLIKLRLTIVCINKFDSYELIWGKVTNDYPTIPHLEFTTLTQPHCKMKYYILPLILILFCVSYLYSLQQIRKIIIFARSPASSVATACNVREGHMTTQHQNTSWHLNRRTSVSL